MMLSAEQRIELAAEDPRLLELAERWQRLNTDDRAWADYLLDWIAYLRSEEPDEPELIDKVLRLREVAEQRHGRRSRTPARRLPPRRRRE
jgi:hypothetical protein